MATNDSQESSGERLELAPTIPSPAFLSTLRPPPLPLWAVPHASILLTASRLSLFVALTSAQIGFQLARTGTQLGFYVARTLLSPIVSGLGAVIDHSLGLEGITGGGIGGGPVVAGLKASLYGAEMLALFGIGIGSEITKATLGTASSTVASLEAVYGNDEALRALGAFLQLVRAEYRTSLPSDPYPEGGLSRWSSIQVGKAAATWGALQSVTGEVYGRRIAGELEELDLKSWGRRGAGENVKESGGEVIWEVTQEETLEGGEEVIEASINQSVAGETVLYHEAETEEERTREHLRRFSKLCLGTYGGMGMLFFGVKLPTPTAATSPPSTPLTPAALTTLSRQLDEDSVAQAFQPRSPTSRTDQSSSAALEAEIGGLEAGWIDAVTSQSIYTTAEGSPAEVASQQDEVMEEASVVGSIDHGLRAETPARIPGSFDLWGLLTGSHDVTVLETLGGLAPGSTRTDLHAAMDVDSSDEEDALSDAEGAAMPGAEVPASGARTSYRTTLGDAERGEKRRERETRKKEREGRRRQEKKGRRPPRFFVITDHPNKSVLLSLRGTMSIDDVATDLACETAHFDETLYWDTPSPSSPLSSASSSSGMRTPKLSDSDGWVAVSGEQHAREKNGYEVHGGMWEVAVAMGGPDGAVTRAVAKALKKNPEYDLFLIGHSLGAGIAALLGIMWTNPETCLTSSKSSLPVGRNVKVYGFAPPCTTDARLSSRCKKLVHSFVYSSDAVSRFSLGHIKDIRSAAAWLCFANENPEESCNNILSRIIAYKRGMLDDDLETKLDEETWFASLRTTLEANMHYADLFPPGDTIWLTRPDDLELPADVPGMVRTAPRLFRVTGRADVVFQQMLFTRTMLSSHLPHQYMQSIEDFL